MVPTSDEDKNYVHDGLWEFFEEDQKVFQHNFKDQKQGWDPTKTSHEDCTEAVEENFANIVVESDERWEKIEAATADAINGVD